MVVIHEYDALELRIGINVYDHRSFLALHKQAAARKDREIQA